jgi:hypothetical protein
MIKSGNIMIPHLRSIIEDLAALAATKLRMARRIHNAAGIIKHQAELDTLTRVLGLIDIMVEGPGIAGKEGLDALPGEGREPFA